jgi:cell division protein FtsI/penicillin-binding protein 2
MNGSIQTRALVVCLALVAGFSVLSARLLDLQWFNRSKWEQTAASSYMRKMPLPAIRGVIVDCNDEIIARDFPITSIVVDMYHLRDANVAALGVAYTELSQEAGSGWLGKSREGQRKALMLRRHRLIESCNGGDLVARHMDHLVSVLARPMGMRPEELRGKIEGSSKDEFVLVAGLNEDDADPLEELVRETRIQGLRFRKGLRRWYASSELAAHAIGFTDHESKGRCGVERSMTRYLTGKDGYRILKRDPRGLLLAPNMGKLKPPIAGFHVQLTLDLGLQSIVEEELDAALVEYQAERAAVLLVEPKTGQILAVASRPTFDLNEKDNVADASFNYAIQAIYEPGSTLKVVATSAALDLGLANPGTQVFCHHGHLSEGRFSVPDHHPYGWLSFEEVLMKSSNIGTYMLAKQVGRENFVDYLKRFGFTSKSGILLSGEEGGMMADPKNAVNFSRMAYGYGVSVTPLQVAMAYAAIANGGNLMKPQIVQSVTANDGTVVQAYEPEIRQRVMSARTSEWMRKALTKVVSKKGTASRAAVAGFLGAGKTGTSLKIRPGGRGYYDDRYVVSFAGILPAEDPAFVCVVVIDDPRTTEVKRYGGTIAAPVYANIARRTAAYMGLTPTEPIEGEAALASTGATKP